MNQCKRAKYESCPSCSCKVTITISRNLANELAYDWRPLDDDDSMIELFEVCRKTLNNEQTQMSLYKEFWEAWLELNKVSETVRPSTEEWKAVQERFHNVITALGINNDDC